MKTMHSRARQLKIATSLYSLSKGLRATYHSVENPRSRIRGVGSGSQVIRRGAVSSFHFYYFGNLEVFFVSFLLLYHCFVILIKYSRA